ncbi:hypothetical protein CYY_003064 [Polysphondylium violaceum]|uniref:Uncharacterized protein n=1 Tax=Polysphondylium violaceum TaxID=133409 RepID=A0A8J4Q792_9MYCE|nr:hypothetical protein CYY_003064 [Polysphondylium violaceum]
MDLLWLVPLIIGAVLWAGCDVIADGVIGEHHEEKEKTGSDHHKAKKEDQVSIDIAAATPTTTGNNSGSSGSSNAKLTGEQDAIISGIVMFFCVAIVHFMVGDSTIYSFYSTYTQTKGVTESGQDRIEPSVVFYTALFSGIFQSFSLIYLLKSFEISSSTIIVPLMQLNSVFILPLSIFLSMLSYSYPILSTFHKIITPTHLVAFILIFFGGFYPSLEGDWMQLTRSQFWRQKSVSQVLLSDFLIAIYYLIVSFCTNETGGMSSTSFLVISIYGNCLTFLALIVFNKRFKESAFSLSGIPRKYVVLSAIGEILSLAGYFFVSISYHLYYNSGIVSAAEGALNQFFNLIVAILLRKFLRFGRDVKRVREKLYSCIIVSIGLVLTST